MSDRDDESLDVRAALPQLLGEGQRASCRRFDLANDSGDTWLTRGDHRRHDRIERTEIWRARVGSSPSLYATLPVRCFEFSVTVSDDGSRAMCSSSSSTPDAWAIDLPRARR